MYNSQREEGQEEQSTNFYYYTYNECTIKGFQTRLDGGGKFPSYGFENFIIMADYSDYLPTFARNTYEPVDWN